MQISLRSWKENMNVVTIGEHELFFSYETLVAYRNNVAGLKLRTAKKFSVTTSKHLAQFGVSDWPQIGQTELENFADLEA